VKFLADDRLEGRETGSEGLRQAESYVVEQLRKSGLEPAGADGFLPAHKIRVPPDRRKRFQRHADSRRQAGTSGPWRRRNLQHSHRTRSRRPGPDGLRRIRLQIPENKFDDLAGLDLQGKIRRLHHRLDPPTCPQPYPPTTDRSPNAGSLFTMPASSALW